MNSHCAGWWSSAGEWVGGATDEWVGLQVREGWVGY